jgi:hypothetical protein
MIKLAPDLRQPQVPPDLPLRYGTLCDVLLAHDREVLVPAKGQEQSGAFHSTEEASEHADVARAG